MRILIADPSKAGLVMTSELFKDHFPGVQVAIARTSAEALEAVDLAQEPFDLVLVDYDLPDRDGIATASALKEKNQGPVVITAIERDGLGEAIEQQLAPYQDCCHWLKKPLRADNTVAFVKDLLSGAISSAKRLPWGALSWATFSPPKKSGLKPACLPVIIEDVCNGGFHLRLATEPLGRLTIAHKKSFQSLAEDLCVEGHLLELYLPELGQNDAQEKELRLMWRQGALGVLDTEDSAAPQKKSTLSGLGKLAKDYPVEKGSQGADKKPKRTTVKAQVGQVSLLAEEGVCLGVYCQGPALAQVEAYFQALWTTVAQTAQSAPQTVEAPRGARGRNKTNN